MRSLVFNIAFLTILQIPGFAQYRVAGRVVSASDSTGVRDCIVYLNDEKQAATTDAYGRFVFNDVPAGQHLLHFTSLDFQYLKQQVAVSGKHVTLSVRLAPREETLQEVLITDLQTNFGFTRMRAVESFGIYEGKKTEVIIPDQMTVNTATNNARQIYARVAGLNIWENDGAGLQLSIGGRGLDPNRSSNFNVRQNGYDISADALGYPESYYTPPVEGVAKIQIIRGAASLQYGTQFGGLINFVMKKPVETKPLELTARQTLGSYGFYNAFTSVGGTNKKLSYYTFFQYKRGDGWRNNSDFNNRTLYANVNYAVGPNTKVGADFTSMTYLAHQPGGLTDDMFYANPRQTNRERNWFKVNWNMYAVHFDHKFNQANEINVRFFGLEANRYSIGFRPNRVATIDDNSERDLIKGDFSNFGVEARYLHRYQIGNVPSVALVGSRFYQGFNHSTQGVGSTGRDADFSYIDEELITYDYRFPNRNFSGFLENIFYIHEKVSLTPGIRFEHINTTARGYYGTIYRDLAGNIIQKTRTDEDMNRPRSFLLAGLGVSYKPNARLEVYSNLSQNYRSITFSDMRITNPSSVIDPNLRDERGYSFDIGARSDQASLYNYDVSYFYLNYDNRIGEVQSYDEFNRVLRRRGNIGQAIIQGVEAYGEADILGLLNPSNLDWTAVVFNNVAVIRSKYTRSEEPGVEGNEVEFVPEINLKNGIRVGYKDLKFSVQFTHLSKQFSDATNATDGGVSAVVGTIPDYSIIDFSASYDYKRFRIEGSINNAANRMYFTRRATGYPGPGIIPSDGRSFFLTLQVKI